MSSVAAYEPFVDKTIATFVREMDRRFASREGPEGSVDLHTWLSFYTFNSISELTYSKPHRFMTSGSDMHGIIGWVAGFLKYGYIVRLSVTLPLVIFHPIQGLYRLGKCHRWTCV